MEAMLENIPQVGNLSLTIHISAAFNVTANGARRAVGRFVADEIGYLLRAGEPKLVASERMYWRVPVLIALPAAGILGEIGAIDADVKTGKLIVTPQKISAIQRNGERLVAGYAAAAGSAP